MRQVRGIAGALLLLLAAMAVGQIAPGSGTTGDAEGEAAIRAVLTSQVDAWNHGRLKAYMEGYWKSTELTFFAGDKESAGWEAAYQRYRAAYQGNGKEMGRLQFRSVRVEMLGPDAAFVRGGWLLTMKDGSRRAGLFTIVLKKFDEGWRIIHDHSS